ncbi:MAG: hypothetical protein QXS81_04945 [Candidatus Micrarchaeaceae archaeon]
MNRAARTASAVADIPTAVPRIAVNRAVSIPTIARPARIAIIAKGVVYKYNILST